MADKVHDSGSKAPTQALKAHFVSTPPAQELGFHFLVAEDIRPHLPTDVSKSSGIICGFAMACGLLLPWFKMLWEMKTLVEDVDPDVITDLRDPITSTRQQRQKSPDSGDLPREERLISFYDAWAEQTSVFDPRQARSQQLLDRPRSWNSPLSTHDDALFHQMFESREIDIVSPSRLWHLWGVLFLAVLLFIGSAYLLLQAL